MQNDVERLTLSQAKATCTSHQCPSCGKHEYVNVERVIVGGMSLTRCHCRTCDHSWQSADIPS